MRSKHKKSLQKESGRSLAQKYKKASLLIGDIMDKVKEKAAIIEQYISSYLELHGKSPRIIDIAEATGISRASVSRILNTYLKKNGRVEGDFKGNIMTNKWRRMLDSSIMVPVVGQISCGCPALAEENIEDYIPLPKQIIGTGHFFILKAHGDSMIGAGINEGDYVIIRQQQTAENGNIIAALLDNEATLKRFYKDTKAHCYRLHPENSNYPDIYTDNCQIQGIVVSVIKNYLK